MSISVQDAQIVVHNKICEFESIGTAGRARYACPMLQLLRLAFPLEIKMDHSIAVNGGSALAMDAPTGSNVATQDLFSGSVSTLASAAGYVIPATWLLGVQICLHGREFISGVISGDPMSLTSASVLMIAGSMTALALRHHRSTSRIIAEIDSVKSLVLASANNQAGVDNKPDDWKVQWGFNWRWDRADQCSKPRL